MLSDPYRMKELAGEFLPAGRLDQKALPCVSRNALLDLIEQGLAEFADRSEFKTIKNEKGITNRLCKMLNCHKLLYFHHEGMQDETTGTSASVDIEAVTTSSTFFEARLYAKEETLMAIEAKRLPSPPPKSREKEYLVGSKKASGGMERFKLGVHGREALCWTMLGYLQKDDFSSWRLKINSWIEDLAKTRHMSGLWESNEKLEVLTQKSKTARFRSQCKRRHRGATDFVEIIHLWVNLN